MKVLRQHFLPADLEAQITAVGIDGVVGWLPLTATDIEAELERWSGYVKIKAVRHVLHDEPDDTYMLREDFNRGIEKLRQFNLVYDILIFEKHLPQTIEFVDRHPGQIFVVDHIAKPTGFESHQMR
ncbi:MAG: amidohydrolase family protein [Phycisphaerae bacterium]